MKSRITLLFFTALTCYATAQNTFPSSGNVGIGVSSPINILDVDGIARFRRLSSATAGLTIGGDAVSLYGSGSNR
ncbi:MAG: hypothetical protein RIA63_04885, partial [Cyclobacteriaceae bacterium]